MDPRDVEKQVRQMANFIRLEAQEKANEIRMKAQADADLEKQMAVLNAKTKLAEEFDRKEKQLAIEQRIKASMEERRQRSRLLVARDEYMQRLSQEAKARLVTAASSNATAYSNLLKGLIKQGLSRLEGETKVEVFCRPQDLAVVQKAAPAAAQEYSAEIAKADPNAKAVSVTVTADQALGNSAGGVTLSGANGRIRCSNTLEDRLGLVLQDLQPVVRDLLFPSARAEVRSKPAVVHAHHIETLPVGGAAAMANAAAARAEANAAAAKAAAAKAQQQQAAGAFAASTPGSSDPFAF